MTGTRLVLAAAAAVTVAVGLLDGSGWPSFVIGAVLGYVTVRVGDGNSASWATGFIVAGAVLPATLATSRDRG